MNINFYLFPLSEDYKKLFLENQKHEQEYAKKLEEPSSLESSSIDQNDVLEKQLIFKMDD